MLVIINYLKSLKIYNNNMPLITFGKHRGKTFEEVYEKEKDYCKWVLDLTDVKGYSPIYHFHKFLKNKKDEEEDIEFKKNWGITLDELEEQSGGISEKKNKLISNLKEEFGNEGKWRYVGGCDNIDETGEPCSGLYKCKPCIKAKYEGVDIDEVKYYQEKSYKCYCKTTIYRIRYIQNSKTGAIAVVGADCIVRFRFAEKYCKDCGAKFTRGKKETVRCTKCRKH